MPSEEHEQIIDEITQCVVNEYSPNWEPTYCTIGQIASWLLGYGGESTRPPAPDLVILPPDDAGPIAVEVGNMPDGKWSEVVHEDGKSIRVLRIGFDRSIWMLRQRYTKAEIALLQLLEERLNKPGAS